MAPKHGQPFSRYDIDSTAHHQVWARRELVADEPVGYVGMRQGAEFDTGRSSCLARPGYGCSSACCPGPMEAKCAGQKDARTEFTSRLPSARARPGQRDQ